MSERTIYALSLLTPLLGVGLIVLVLLMAGGCAFSAALYAPWHRPPEIGGTAQAKPAPTPAPTPDLNAALIEYLRSLQPSPTPRPDVQPVPSPSVSTSPLEGR